MDHMDPSAADRVEAIEELFGYGYEVFRKDDFAVRLDFLVDDFDGSFVEVNFGFGDKDDDCLCYQHGGGAGAGQVSTGTLRAAMRAFRDFVSLFSAEERFPFFTLACQGDEIGAQRVRIATLMGFVPSGVADANGVELWFDWDAN